MNKRLIINLAFWVTLLMSISGLSQIYYNQQSDFLNANKVWNLGGNTGIDFGNGLLPISLEDLPNDWGDGATSVSDPVTGELLFYTDASAVRNRNHQIMPNGDSLLGNDAGTVNQGHCIIPVIDTPGKYYLFSLYGPSGYQLDSYTSSINKDSLIGSLYYSVINMSLDSGLGDIELGRKNIILATDSLSESMIAIPGCNNDIWLVVHDFMYPTFRSFHITASGISNVPIVSHCSDNFLPSQLPYTEGLMTISPNRKNLAITSNGAYAALIYALTGTMPAGMAGLLLYEFDPSNGEVGNNIEIEQNAIISSAFSPNSNKLYYTSLTKVNNETIALLNQVDISLFDSASISNSKIVIHDTTVGSPNYLLYNDTIYLTGQRTRSISRINKPNELGVACEFQTNAILLPPGMTTGLNFPNQVVYPYTSLTTVSTMLLDTTLCKGDIQAGWSLAPRLISSDSQHHWNDGSLGPQKTIFQPGVYWVSYRDCENIYIDTFNVRSSELLQPQINVNGFKLGVTQSYKTYQWMYNDSLIPWATDSILLVTKNGRYHVIVSNEDGCVDTSESYLVTNVGITKQDQRINVMVYPNPVGNKIYITAPFSVIAHLATLDGKLLYKVNQQNSKEQLSINISDLSPGMYFLTIFNSDKEKIKTEKIIKRANGL